MFSPTTWLGIVLAVAAGALLGTARWLGRRQRLARGESPKRTLRPTGRPTRGGDAVDDDLADIEEILRRRGIS